MEKPLFVKGKEDDLLIAQSIVKNPESGSVIFKREIFEKYKQEVWNICNGLLKSYTQNRQDVEDLVQDTFIIVAEKLSQFKGDSPIKFWIGKIARNTTLLYIERKMLKLRKTTPNVSSFAEGAVLEKRSAENPKDSPEEIFIQTIIQDPALLEKIFPNAPMGKLIFELFYLKQLNETEIQKYLIENHYYESIKTNQLRSTKDKAIKKVQSYFTENKSDFI
ncbi:MAG: sigma-70 family RNA polymerase sigma factor [bacterium]|nr:sigma-70 family RNA polymerase sigma factor [bacterium]